MPGTNQLLGNALTNRGKYAREKRKWQTVVQLYAKEQDFQPITEPAHFEFEFLEPNRRRNPDNLCLGPIKVLLDALVYAKLLKNDGWDEIASFVCTWKVDKQPGVRLTVR